MNCTFGIVVLRFSLRRLLMPIVRVDTPVSKKEIEIVDDLHIWHCGITVQFAQTSNAIYASKTVGLHNWHCGIRVQFAQTSNANCACRHTGPVRKSSMYGLC